MIKNTRNIFRDAHSTLSRLGLVLFYFYMLFALLGSIGMLFAIITAIQKLILIHSTLTASWWEVIGLFVVSWLMLKIFSREASHLANTDTTKNINTPENVTNEEAPQRSNVIPFNKKPSW